MPVHRLVVAAPTDAPVAAVTASPGRAEVDVTARSLRRDGRAIFPLSGEIHYSRVPRRRWDRVLRAARAGGLTHVSTYVLWNHHEAERGAYDFAGGKDVRAFAAAALDAGLEVILRIGPYAHAESRHGGLPDWLADSGLPLRTNDPGYLAEVDRWYARLAAEVRGIPLFSVQVDNELYDGAAHLGRLREMAETHGFAAPLWTATAWGAAQVPDGFLPVYGGYPESFWVEADSGPDLRSFSNFYPTPRRDDDSIGADHRGDAVGASRASSGEPFPFATCELGSGMTSAYHRRLNVPAADVAALALAKLASGSVWQGYYMYGDGRNPAPRLQESHETGAPNDFVDLSYDFGAPVQVDGAVRPSWFALRRQHALIDRWGAALAEMPASFPDDAVDTPDVTGLRWSVRSDGTTGFVFVVNRQPSTELPAHADTRFVVTGPSGTVEFPPVDVPSGAAFAWPFGLAVGDVTLAWLTAQPIAELEWRGAPLLVAAATAGIRPQLAADADVEFRAPGGRGASAGRGVSGGRGAEFELRRDGEVRARVLVLDEADADAVVVAGGRLVWAPGAVVGADGSLEFAGAAAADAAAEVLGEDGWQPVDVAAVPVAPATWTIEREAGAAPAAATGASGRASVPSDWSGAALVTVPLDPADERTLALSWSGDVARAWDGDRLVSDAVWTGRPWRIPAEERGGATELRVEILPAPPTGRVYFPAEPPTGAAVTAAEFESVVTAQL
ncbi:beta-galactosidase [Microbacterium sp. 179-B 1A2 NHS]|uniref:beta-galactosidase n=1 Tax=Microbacterium sp. 179-B 1A2 NHS TaxID=3142383 RepID=UPI0039A0B47E